MRIVASERGPQLLDWGGGRSIGPRALVEDAQAQLEEYFAGRRIQFDLALDLAGTLFQNAYGLSGEFRILSENEGSGKR